MTNAAVGAFSFFGLNQTKPAFANPPPPSIGPEYYAAAIAMEANK